MEKNSWPSTPVLDKVLDKMYFPKLEINKHLTTCAQFWYVLSDNEWDRFDEL